MRKLNAIQITEEPALCPAAELMPAALPQEFDEEKEKSPVFKKIGQWVEKIKIKPFPWKGLSLRNALIASCLVLVAVAGFINVRYSLNKAEADPVVENPEQSTLNPGEIEQNFFATAVIDRERVRDEALEVLVGITEDETADEAAKADAFGAMERIAYETSCEIDIENLVKAKGFAECVAVVSGDGANIVVKSDGLTPGEIAQIKEIVYLEANILPKNIKIIERDN